MRSGRRNYLSAAVVIALHIVLIYAISTALGITQAPKLLEPMTAMLIETPKQTQPTPPAPPEPKIAEPMLDVPVPEVVEPIPVEETIEVPAEATVTDPGPVTEDANLAVTRRVEPTYPAASRRLNEEGTVTVRVLVDERGRPGDVQVVNSSGHPRLDSAALQAIRRWVFAPAVRGSQAVPAWTTVRVTFQLNNA